MKMKTGQCSGLSGQMATSLGVFALALFIGTKVLC